MNVPVMCSSAYQERGTHLIARERSFCGENRESKWYMVLRFESSLGSFVHVMIRAFLSRSDHLGVCQDHEESFNHQRSDPAGFPPHLRKPRESHGFLSEIEHKG